MTTNQKIKAAILAEEYARKAERGDTSVYDGRTRNACRCGICQSPADRVGGPEFFTGFDNDWYYFECQANPEHIAEAMTGIFTDCSFPV